MTIEIEAGASQLQSSMNDEVYASSFANTAILSKETQKEAAAYCWRADIPVVFTVS